MELELGRGKMARRAYGFDEVALVPGRVTINPEEIDVSFALNGVAFDIPFMAAAMDGVVDVRFAREMGRLGGMGVLNLDGVQTRYEDPTEVLQTIAESTPQEINVLLQRIYTAPVQDGLIGLRVEEIKAAGVRCAVSSTPANAERRASIVQEAGADVFVVQGTVLTARHISKSYKHLSFKDLTASVDIPVIAGNCVDYATALELMDTGVKGLLVGVGPGAACTTRGVLGVGVPQVTATADCAAARDDHLRRSGERVSIITDGGMRLGGDVAKAFASGADGVMIGSIFAAAEEAAGHGNHWGMATPDPNLPRGTRIRTGIKAPLREILFGPAHVDDGSMNLVGALKSSMGVCGARNVQEFQRTEMVIAPSIKTEGKMQQREQHVGMGV
jgi:IMP dehydrogenase